MSEREESRQADQSGHPEIDRAYDRDRGGEVPEDQGESGEYRGPDPERDSSGDADDEDQGV